MPVTNHGKKRAKQRAGICGGSADKMAKRILKHGIKHSETKGDMHKWMDWYYVHYKTANQTRFYGDSFYLFSGCTLITVIPAKPEIVHNLEEYVDEDALLRYRQFKESKHKNKNRSRIISNKIREESEVVHVSI